MRRLELAPEHPAGTTVSMESATFKGAPSLSRQEVVEDVSSCRAGSFCFPLRRFPPLSGSKPILAFLPLGGMPPETKLRCGKEESR